MCAALSKHVNELTLYYRDKSRKNCYLKDEIIRDYDLSNNFKMKGYGCDGYLTTFLSSFKVAFEIVRDKPEFVYSREILILYLVSFFKIPFALEIHKPVGGVFKGYLFKRILRSKNIRVLIAITSSLKERVESDFPAYKGKIEVVPDAADPMPTLARSNTASSLEIHPDGGLNVGYLGHLYDGKGMEVIEELAPLAKWARFHIVGGEGEDVERWRDRVRQISNIIFYGHVQYAKIPTYIHEFDVALLPNLRNVKAGGDIGSWTSPLKMFEYMAAGRAIIASDIPVLKEILKNSETAILCDPDVIQEWIVALEIFKEKRIREGFGQRAKEEFLTNYTWKIRAQKIISIILSE
jgi:glycosyltransferase involved in cell wall biosynthesis